MKRIVKRLSGKTGSRILEWKLITVLTLILNLFFVQKMPAQNPAGNQVRHLKNATTRTLSGIIIDKATGFEVIHPILEIYRNGVLIKKIKGDWKGYFLATITSDDITADNLSLRIYSGNHVGGVVKSIVLTEDMYELEVEIPKKNSGQKVVVTPKSVAAINYNLFGRVRSVY